MKVMKKDKYDLIKILRVIITDEISTNPAFRVGNMADCKCVSQKKDFVLSSIGHYPVQMLKCDPAKFKCVQIINKFGTLVPKIADRLFSKEDLDKDKYHQQYPLTEEECFQSPKEKSRLLRDLFKNLSPDVRNNGPYIHEKAEAFLKIIEKLKAESPYYPHMIRKVYNDEVFYSTMVRIKISRYWYAIHTVQFYSRVTVGNIFEAETNCIKTLVDQAYTIQISYKDPVDNEMDWLQIPEEERLEQNITR